MKKLLIVLGTAALFLFSSFASAASIPKLAWPTAYRTINLSFGSAWPYSSPCTYLTWKHTGIDIKAPKTSSVYAAEKGVVKVSQDSGTSWKQWITIGRTDSYGQKYTTVYWHLANRKVSVGAAVTRGQKIAEVADMGGNTHLHFGLRNASYSNNTSNRGGLPTGTCSGFSVYPESFKNPLNYLP